VSKRRDHVALVLWNSRREGLMLIDKLRLHISYILEKVGKELQGSFG
jgi:hypothetical protein